MQLETQNKPSSGTLLGGLERQVPVEQLELLLDDTMPDLESYTIRVSKRARSVSLRVVPLQGLEVTIPQRFPRREVPRVIAENRDWIVRQYDKVARETDPEYLDWPPRVLRLRAIETVVQVQCRSLTVEHLQASWEEGLLRLSGNLTQRRLVLQVIAQALKSRAQVILPPALKALAEERGLVYRRCSIRGQKTVWGSYSSSGTLSLNYKLLFLPPELVRYVLLHELAHTRFLNHSRQFWSFLETIQPGARGLDRALGDAGKLVPPWLEAL